MPEAEQQQADQVDDAQRSATDESEIDWKAKAREWEKRAKDNHKRVQELEPRASQFDALEAASKSELQRTQEQLAEIQRQAEESQHQALVASVALAKGLPANLVSRLRGSSQEELEADADELLATFNAGNASRPPAPDPSQGSSARRSTAGPEQDFANFLSAAMRRG